MNVSRGATTRRHILATGLFALVSAFLPGAAVVQDVHADKKKKPKIPSVAERTENQRDICEAGGGKLAVLDGPDGGNTTECKKGTNDGYTCFNTKKKTTCTMQLTNSPTKPGGGGAVPPSGVNEQPSDGKPVGGGTGTGPTGGVEDPSDGKPVGGGGAVGPTGGVEEPGGSTVQPDGPLLLKAGYGDRPRHSRKRNRRGRSRKT